MAWEFHEYYKLPLWLTVACVTMCVLLKPHFPYGGHHCTRIILRTSHNINRCPDPFVVTFEKHCVLSWLLFLASVALSESQATLSDCINRKNLPSMGVSWGSQGAYLK